MKLSKGMRERRFDIPLNIWIKEHSTLIVPAMIFVAGIIIGSLISAELTKSGINAILYASESFMTKREQQTIVKTFISALLPNAAVWTALFVCGFCAVSAPLIYLIPCIRGMGFGMIACAIFISGSDNSVRYIFLHLMPNIVIMALVTAYCCRDAHEMSIFFWKSMSVYSKTVNSGNINAAVFCGKMLIYGIIIIAGAFLEAYSYTAF